MRPGVPVRQIALIVAALAVLASPRDTGAEQAGTLRTVAVLLAAAPPGSPLEEAFRQGLRELGWRDGENVKVDFRTAAQHYERLPQLAAELARSKPEVIFAPALQAAIAIRNETATIPIVIGAIDYDPLEIGLVASIAKPGGNVTGLFLRQIELTGKRLELLRAVVPDARRVGVLFDAAGRYQLTETERLVRSAGLHLQRLQVETVPELNRAFAAAGRARARALIVLGSPFTYIERGRIADLAVKHRLATISPFSELTEAGALMSYGASIAGMFRQAARHVDKILKGAPPQTLPVEQPTQFELVVNRKTARALNLTVPQSVLILADRVID